VGKQPAREADRVADRGKMEKAKAAL